MHQRLLWLDFETTGLIPECDFLLELAMALTDPQLNVVAEFHRVVAWRNVRSLVRDPTGEGAWVMRTHNANGLFDECERATQCLREVEADAIRWVHQHNAAGLYMGGSGPQFDRGWGKVQTPALIRLWHYRNVDLTTLRYFFGAAKTEAPHRAMPDVRQNIADFRGYVTRARQAGLLALPAMVTAA